MFPNGLEFGPVMNVPPRLPFPEPNVPRGRFARAEESAGGCGGGGGAEGILGDLKRPMSFAPYPKKPGVRFWTAPGVTPGVPGAAS
jgi:hypothetical protein